MKNILFILFLLNFSFSQTTKRTLFLGNSYTYYNNLPQLIASLATADNNQFIFDSNTPGGYTLQGHTSNSTSLSKIQQGNWDYVVLQEQSQIPSFSDNYVENNCFPYAAQLNNTILQFNPCAETVFYMTWGRENGDSENCSTNPAVCTYEGMDNLLRLRYTQMATNNQGILSPVGVVWRSLRTNFPNLNLYSSDGSHPSLLGSYAAACTFYTLLFRTNPENNSYNPGLSNIDMQIIRNTVKSIVYEHLQDWFVGTYDPNASFTTSLINTNQFQFTNTSTFAESYLWNFGDGSTSIETNPIHTYSMIAPYTVTLTATKCNTEDLTTVYLNLLSLNTITPIEKLKVYPNPVEDFTTITSSNTIDSIEIYDSIGHQITHKTIASKSYEIDLKNLPLGIYFIKINQDEFHTFEKIIKK